MSEERAVRTSATVGADLQHEIEQLLYTEAELLDSFRLEEWLDLLTEDITIEAPIRRNTHPGTDQSPFSEEGHYIYNEYDILRERVTRLGKEYAWAENPRSRVRHLITNVRVVEAEADEYVVQNNRRRTTLRRVDGELKIANRVVYFDDSVLDMKNLTIVML